MIDDVALQAWPVMILSLILAAGGIL